MNPATPDKEYSPQKRILNQIRDFGDSLERAGEKVEKRSWEAIGTAISKLENSLELLKKTKAKKIQKLSKNSKVKKPLKLSNPKVNNPEVGRSDSQAY
jgi:hypothetical protein